MFKIENIAFYFIFIIISLIAIFVAIYSLSLYPFCFFDDNFAYSVIKSILYCIFHPQGVAHIHEGYISFLATSLFCFHLPCKLNLHPDYFINYYIGYIMGLFIVMLTASMAKYSGFYKKNKFLFLFSYVFFVIYYYYSIFYNGGNEYIENKAAFFKYPFILVFFAIYWFLIYRSLIYKIPSSKKIVITISIILFSLFVYTNCEIIIFTSLGTLLLILLYQLIIYIISGKGKNKYIKKSYFLNINKFSILLISISFCISLLYIMVTAINFHLLNIHGNLLFHELCLYITEYTHLYIQILFKKEFIIWIFYIPIIISSFLIAYKQKEIKKVVLPIFMLISIFILMYSLIIYGKNFYDRGTFWLMHDNIVICYKFIILMPLFMLISYLYSKTQNNLKKYYVMLLCFILLCACIFMIYSKDIKNVKGLDIFKKYRQDLYTNEKIFRFYRLKNQKPIMQLYDGYILSESYSILNPKYEDEIRIYFNNVYKDEEILNENIRWEYRNNAIQQYYELGGILTKEELEDINFQRLLNDDFVLGKK